jgi:hypothetical protein
MSWRTAFGPLLRSLTGGRFPAPTRARKGGDHRFGRLWADLVVQLELSPGAFDELVLAGSLHPHFHYRHFTRPKKGGGRREIVEPDVKLKRVQRAILAHYLHREQPHPAAIAFRKKKSIADHVWAHAGAEVLVTADVQDFFPNTHEGRVREWWEFRVGQELAQLLTLLTTWRGGLPQGAPTSPALSNLLNHDLDERLACRALVAGAHYTRYCDDMVFSWRHGDGPPSDFQNGVRAALQEFGYVLHPEKGWRVHSRRDEPEVAGVILTRRGHVRLPDHLRRVMRELERSDDPHDVERLAGYQGYEAMVTKARTPGGRSGTTRGPLETKVSGTFSARKPLEKVPDTFSKPVAATDEEDIPF